MIEEGIERMVQSTLASLKDVLHVNVFWACRVCTYSIPYPVHALYYVLQNESTELLSYVK